VPDDVDPVVEPVPVAVPDELDVADDVEFFGEPEDEPVSTDASDAVSEVEPEPHAARVINESAKGARRIVPSVMTIVPFPPAIAPVSRGGSGGSRFAIRRQPLQSHVPEQGTKAPSLACTMTCPPVRPGDAAAMTRVPGPVARTIA
jgi:hypothetical protein